MRYWGSLSCHFDKLRQLCEFLYSSNDGVDDFRPTFAYLFIFSKGTQSEVSSISEEKILIPEVKTRKVESLPGIISAVIVTFFFKILFCLLVYLQFSVLILPDRLLDEYTLENGFTFTLF